MDFPEKFKAARKALGLTQHQLADKTLIPFRTIQSWEGGERLPPEWCQILVLEKLERMKNEKE